MDSQVNHTRIEMALAFQQGEEYSLAFFFSEFHPALCHYAFQWLQNRSQAEEIASEAFVKTWKMHRKLNHYFAIRNYLYITVRRDCQRTIRKEIRIKATQEEAQRYIPQPETPFDNLLKTETYRLVHNALSELAPGSRQVLTMHFLEGKSTGEIARELHISPSTVKTQKARGLQALRKIIPGPLIFIASLLFLIIFSSL